MYCNVSNPVTKTSLGITDGTTRSFRVRTAQPGRGAKTPFSSSKGSLTFDSGFYNTCDLWGKSMADFFIASPDKLVVADWGHVGTKACHRRTWAHNRARGMDLCGIFFTNGEFVDSNFSHSSNADTRQKRWYLAVSANLRRYVRTVLTADYNAAHRDHIHFDNRYPVSPLSTGRSTDAQLIQRACTLLLPDSSPEKKMPVDGDWGPQTSRGYNQLVNGVNMQCRKPLAVTRDTRDLLYFLVKHAVDNVTIGSPEAASSTYKSVEC